MVQLTVAEQTAIDHLLECIAEAMSRLDEVDPKYANKTKLQKLLYLSIDEFDLPITYSWYLAGAIVPGDTATPTNLRSAFDDLPNTETPTTPGAGDSDADEKSNASSASASAFGDFSDTSQEDLVGGADGPDLDKADPELDLGAAVDEDADESVDPILFSSGASPRGPSAGDEPVEILGDRRDEIIDFYESVLPEVWKQSTMRFLQNFYLEHAPEPYRDLYVQSTHLRIRLHDIEIAVKEHLHNEQPDKPIDQLVEEAGLDISDLHHTIRSSDTLAPTFDEFVRGTNLIEDGLMMLAQQNSDELTQNHLEAVRATQEFFYYYVWRYPCLFISKETATGPSKKALKESRERRFATFDEELENQAEQFEQALADAGLLPDYTDYSLQDDDIAETMSSLADHYLK